MSVYCLRITIGSGRVFVGRKLHTSRRERNLSAKTCNLNSLPSFAISRRRDALVGEYVEYDLGGQGQGLHGN